MVLSGGEHLMMLNFDRLRQAGSGCACDIHFQQSLVEAADDFRAFATLKTGYARPLFSAELDHFMASQAFNTSFVNLGQTSTADSLFCPGGSQVRL